jgi:hypothetical protein
VRQVQRLLLAAPVNPDYQDYQQDDGTQDQPGSADPLLRHLPAGAEHIAQGDEANRPEHRSQCIVEHKLSVRHVRRPGDERNQRSREPDEPAEENRLGPLSLEEPLHFGEPSLPDSETRPSPQEPLSAEPEAQKVSDVITHHGSGCSRNHHRYQVENSLVSQETGGEHQTLPRHQESSEGGTLQGGCRKNDEVAPGTQPRDQIEQILEKLIRQGWSPGTHVLWANADADEACRDPLEQGQAAEQPQGEWKRAELPGTGKDRANDPILHEDLDSLSKPRR